MSYTISSGKMAAAFKTTKGKIVYALFEKTNQSNVFPQEPKWGCIALGEYTKVMRVVFNYSSACEGGGLKGSGNRDMKPENYIAAWHRELLNPLLLDDAEITISAGKSMYDSFSTERPESLEQCRNILIQHGRENSYEQVLAGGLKVNLYADIDLVLSIFGSDVGCVAPWRALRRPQYCHVTSIAQPELAPKSTNSPFEPAVLKVLKIDRYNFLVQVDGGKWSCWGWAYRTVGDFITKYAYEYEMKKSGSAKRLISEFRSLCEKAVMVPPQTMVTFQLGDEMDRWQIEAYQSLGKLVAEQIGAPFDPNAIEKSFSCRLVDIPLNENGDYVGLHHVKADKVIWHIKDAESGVQTPRQSELLAA